MVKSDAGQTAGRTWAARRAALDSELAAARAKFADAVAAAQESRWSKRDPRVVNK